MSRRGKAFTEANAADFNWLTPNDEGTMVSVVGHWTGDFVGVVEYGGRELAIITDADGQSREICYLRGITICKL